MTAPLTEAQLGSVYGVITAAREMIRILHSECFPEYVPFMTALLAEIEERKALTPQDNTPKPYWPKA